MTCCGGTAKWCVTTAIGSPTIIGPSRAHDGQRGCSSRGHAMRRTTTERLVTAAPVAAGAMSQSIAVGQTPGQEKLWEAQRAPAQADGKGKAGQLAPQPAGRRANPHSIL